MRSHCMECDFTHSVHSAFQLRDGCSTSEDPPSRAQPWPPHHGLDLLGLGKQGPDPALALHLQAASRWVTRVRSLQCHRRPRPSSQPPRPSPPVDRRSLAGCTCAEDRSTIFAADQGPHADSSGAAPVRGQDAGSHAGRHGWRLTTEGSATVCTHSTHHSGAVGSRRGGSGGGGRRSLTQARQQCRQFRPGSLLPAACAARAGSHCIIGG